MAKKAAQAKDKTRVTIRFRNEAVAEEFYRRAEEANMRASPFAAELIEQALTASDAIEFEQSTVHRESEQLRALQETLRGLPQELASNNTSNDEVLAELTMLRREINDLKQPQANATGSSEELRKLFRELEHIRAEMKELAELPHMCLALREDFATGVRPLLVRACGLSHDEAEDWIRQYILEE